MRLFLCLLMLAVFATPSDAKTRSKKELAFIYMRGDNNSIMSGSLTDLKRVKQALKKGERALWFRATDGKEMIVRDPAILDSFEAAWKAADAIGEQMGAIGEKQGAIGTKLGAIGAKQGKLGLEEGSLSLDLEDAKPTRRKAIEKRLREIGDEMRALDDQMEELEAPMHELEKQMDGLQKKHDVVVAKAHADTDALIARAITSGAAKPL